MGKRGNPGYGKSEMIRQNVDKFSPVFWQLMEEFATSKSKEDKRFFIQEFNKIQVKMIPQELTGKDGKDLIPVPILSNMNVQPHNSDQENSPAPETD